MLERPRVLVLGAGTGSDVLQALYHSAGSVEAVELNRQVTGLVQERFADFAGRPYSAPGVSLHIGEARAFAAATANSYDLIQLALLDAFGASSAGLYALAESYLYTVEALQIYLRRLAAGGILSITRWVTLPPRDSLKLFGMAVMALEREGVREPGKRLVLIRSWRTATLLVKNGEWSEREIERLKQFAQTRSFDFGWYPGMPPQEADRYNLLDRPYFYEGAAALLSAERQQFIDRYKFDIAPATDDRPYFFHFFRWRALPELLRLKGQGGLPLLEWGYPLRGSDFPASDPGQRRADPVAAMGAAPARTRPPSAERSAGACRSTSRPSAWRSCWSRSRSFRNSGCCSAIRCTR